MADHLLHMLVIWQGVKDGEVAPPASAGLSFEPMTLAFRGINYYVPKVQLPYAVQTAGQTQHNDCMSAPISCGGLDVGAPSPAPMLLSPCHCCIRAPHKLQPKARGEELQLLRNVSGTFRPRVLTALMGASGAGKVRVLSRQPKWPKHLPSSFLLFRPTKSCGAAWQP